MQRPAALANTTPFVIEHIEFGDADRATVPPESALAVTETVESICRSEIVVGNILTLFVVNEPVVATT